MVINVDTFEYEEIPEPPESSLVPNEAMIINVDAFEYNLPDSVMS